MHARIGWQNLRTSEFLDSGDYMLITGTDFIDGAVNFDTCHYVERERYEQDKHIQIRNGSILITKDGTLGKVAYIQGLTMPATLNAGVFNVEIKDENEVDNRYLFQYLKAPFLMDYVDKKATGGTIKHLNQNILVDFPVVLPHKAEQEKIGEYFLAIDHLITLHQREFAFLCKEKSKKFRYIKNAWEQRKLGDIASDMVAGGDIDKDLILAEGQYPVIANALTGDGIVGYYDKEYRVNAPAVTVTGRGNVGHAKARLVNFTPVVRLLSVKSEHDVFFLENAINTLKIVIESTGVPQLTVPQLAKYEVAFPRQLDEEEHIGAFFKQLDHLITLHQRKPNFYTGGYYAE